jgi:hypothetical protein
MIIFLTDLFQKKKEVAMANKSFPEATEAQGYSERDLHPILSYFVNRSVKLGLAKSIYTKTIFHEEGRKTGYSEWVYPDLVGFYLPIRDWERPIIEFNNITEQNLVRLFSFELKKCLNKGNYRSSFFQAVSNSSWAHEGYLVCAQLQEDDEELLLELERLSQSFGIGIINLNIKDFNSGKVMFQAKPKENLDWHTMNKLCHENPGYKDFIEHVKRDFESKTIYKQDYDDIPKDDEIENYIKKLLKGNGASYIKEPNPRTSSSLKEGEFSASNRAGANATAIINGAGVTVKKGSVCSPKTANSFPSRYADKVTELEKAGIIKNGIFTADHTFSSASSAGSIVLRASVNGLSAWKNKDGNPLG